MQESGFVHSAFSFAHECMLGRTGLRSADRTLPPGALVTFLQKGLQYIGMEEALRREQNVSSSSSNNNTNTNSARRGEVDFSLLSPPVIASITRENPPIQLNVPAASAAAAVKARLEARLRAEQQNAASALSSQLVVNGPLSTLPGANPATAAAPPPPPGMEDASALAVARQQQALAAQAAAAQAAVAMSQFQMGGAAPAHVLQSLVPGGAPQPAAAAAELLALQQSINAATGGGPDLRAPQHMEVNNALAAMEAGNSAKRSTTSSTAAASKKSSKKQKKDGSSKTSKETSPIPPADTAKPMEIDQVEGSSKNKVIEDSKHMNGQKDRNGAATNPQVGNGGPQTLSTSNPSEQASADNKGLVDSNVPDNEIIRLEMHQSEVFMCAWNPVFTYLIATGSGDASARIWHMGGTKAKDGLTTVKLLPHGSDPRDRKNKDVTTLEWSPDGTLLATGSYDGVARVWARSGALIHTLRGHNGPIFSLKWNKRGNYLLSGSYDKTTIVWDVSGPTGFVEQQFTDHEAPALDVDWKDNTTFASCSTDKTVHICRVGTAAPIKIYTGHQDEVNGVKWDPSGKLLASCSDDCTAKVWDVESDRTTPLYDFKSHQQEIYTVKWSPTGPGSNFPEKKAMLATASFDGSVRLWDVTDGSCFRVFNRHQDSVYSVAFSPSGDFLASGSLAGQMYIWNIQEGKHIKSYKGKGDIFEVAWNKEETRVAACFSSNVVAVIDFQRPSQTQT